MSFCGICRCSVIRLTIISQLFHEIVITINFHWSFSGNRTNQFHSPLLSSPQDQHLVSLLQPDFKPPLPVLAALHHVQVPVFCAAFFRPCFSLLLQPLAVYANLLLKLGRGCIQSALLGKSVLGLTIRLTVLTVRLTVRLPFHLTVVLICWQIRVCSDVVCFFLRLSIGLSIGLSAMLLRRQAVRCIFRRVLRLALWTLR